MLPTADKRDFHPIEPPVGLAPMVQPTRTGRGEPIVVDSHVGESGLMVGVPIGGEDVFGVPEVAYPRVGRRQVPLAFGDGQPQIHRDSHIGLESWASTLEVRPDDQIEAVRTTESGRIQQFDYLMAPVEQGVREIPLP